MFLPWDKNHKEAHPYFRCVEEETFCSAGFGVGVAWIGESAVGWGGSVGWGPARQAMLIAAICK